MDNEFIEIEFYEEGRWVTRRLLVDAGAALAEQILRALPRETAVNLNRRLMASLGAHESSLPEQPQEGQLKILAE